MVKVTVVMSTYNGGKYLERQLDSIFAQVEVDVQVYVRDDGSTDNTLDVIERYQKEKQPERLTFSFEENCGWQRSFLKALVSAPEAEYYAFSDQDDIWFPEKLYRCVEELEKHDSIKPLMIHHDRKRVDAYLNPLPDTAIKLDRPLNYQHAVIAEMQGCAMVFNKATKDLVCRYMPKVKVPHDQWVNTLCYYFGEIYSINEPLFYHIQYGCNTSTAGNARGGQIHRLKTMLAGKNVYDNVADDLLTGYGELLSNKQRKFLIRLHDYKHNFYYRLRLLLSPKFRRTSKLGTIGLKMAILLGKI